MGSADRQQTLCTAKIVCGRLLADDSTHFANGLHAADQVLLHRHNVLPPKLSLLFFYISGLLRAIKSVIRSDQRESDDYRTPPSHWRGAASWKSSSWQYLLGKLCGHAANEIYLLKSCRFALPLALAWRYYSTRFPRKKVAKLTSDGWILTSMNGLWTKYVPNNWHFIKFL